MLSTAPDIAELPLPMDRWTQPFWEAAARKRLVLPCCGDCRAWRWPPMPFCPKCRSQALDWLPAGPARIYSYTILHQPDPPPERTVRLIVPALVEFSDAGGVRLVAPIVDSPVSELAIGKALTLRWAPKDQTNVPVFTLSRSP